MTSGSNPLTSAAIRVGKPEASNEAIDAAPLAPAHTAAHVDAASLPTGVTAPMPVIATRLRPLTAILPADRIGSLRSPDLGGRSPDFDARRRDEAPIGARGQHRAQHGAVGRCGRGT